MRYSLAIVVLFLLPIVAFAQSERKVYLDPGHNQFSSYFSAALQKKNVPVTVTIDPHQADFMVTFRLNNSNGSLLQGITSALNGNLNTGAFNEVTMTVINEQTKDVTFSYTCKKYDKYTAANNDRATSVAECLAKHWKDKLKKG